MTLQTDPQLVADRKIELYRNAPLHPRSDLRAWKSTVIVAPHPDDEALGCGGLIAELSDLERMVRILFVSDGAMSHPNSATHPRERRVALREYEALQASRILGVPADRVAFLRQPDTRVPREWDDTFGEVVATVTDHLRTWSVDTLVVPWRRDPHGDHRASWEIFRAAARRYGPVRWIEYPVWMWEADNAVDLPRPEEMITWRLDVTDQLSRKERAIRAHRSQWAGVIADDPTGFQLADGMVAHFLRPAELYFEDAIKRQHSLTESYFNGVYRNSSDPWNFETSPYEREKYAATLAALPEKRYRSGFEIGCSIGVLTEQLARCCDRLLAVDTSPQPLERARKRLDGQRHVTFWQMQVPSDFPKTAFDLIVLSEVGYYWGCADLERAVDRIKDGLNPGGTLILVHFTPYVPDYPLTGDEVHARFTERLRACCYHVHGQRMERYRIDVWKKHGTCAPSV